MDSAEIIKVIQNLGAPVVYSLLALWFIKYQFVKAEEAAERGRLERQRIIYDSLPFKTPSFGSFFSFNKLILYKPKC